MSIPAFKTYYPTIEGMNADQRRFYNSLRESLFSSHFPSVDGNISYLFVYVYEILQTSPKKGYSQVYARLLDLAEAYFEERQFAEYCRYWAYDCLLGLENYSEFLRLTEQLEVFGTNTHFSNTRCNVFFHMNQEPSAVDIFKLVGFRVTSFTEGHQAAFRDFLEQVFSEFATKEGPWLKRILAHQDEISVYPHTLFQGAPIPQTESKFKFYCFYAAYDFNNEIQLAVREAENRLREANKMPRVGEGWISETELYYCTKRAFPQTQVIQHGKPLWLGRQHLDIWLPRWNIAVEYNGTQHFEPVEIFGGKSGFDENMQRDEKKLRLCHENGVYLIIATEIESHDEVINKIVEARQSMQPRVKGKVILSTQSSQM